MDGIYYGSEGLIGKTDYIGRQFVRAQIFNAGIILGQGNSTTPALRFMGDADTGLFSPGPDRIGFVTGGTLRWEVSALGHLLAGTDGAYDIGSATGGRPRNVYITGGLTAGDQLNVSPAVAKPPFVLGANAQGQKVIGLNADLLDGIDETQFVRTDLARTISVQHTFNPSAAGAPFILGANAQNQLVAGLNADLVDGQHLTDLDVRFVNVSGDTMLGNLTVRGQVIIQRSSSTDPISLALATETGTGAAEFGLSATAGHFSNLALANDLVIRNSLGNRIVLALGNSANNFSAGAIVGYPSGGVYIGSSPSDPGANNVRIQNNLYVTNIFLPAGGNIQPADPNADVYIRPPQNGALFFAKDLGGRFIFATTQTQRYNGDLVWSVEDTSALRSVSVYANGNIEHRGRLASGIPTAYSEAPPYLIHTAWPTANDLTIRSGNGGLFCVGRVNGHLTGNVYFDGTNWNNFATDSYGIVAISQATAASFVIYYTSPGPNPRTRVELARLAWATGGQTAHVLRSPGGAYYADWPASWGGGLGTLDITCSGIYYNTLVQRSNPALKQDIRPLNTQAKDKIRQLSPIVFKFADDAQGKDRYGFSAADVYRVMPELCEYDEAGRPIGYDLGGLVTYLVKIIQELIDELEAVKAKVGV